MRDLPGNTDKYWREQREKVIEFLLGGEGETPVALRASSVSPSPQSPKITPGKPPNASIRFGTP
jgi:hypothetical protein